MYSQRWLAYAVVFLPALSASILRARQNKDSSTISPLRLITPENAKPPISSNAIQQPSINASLYDISFGNNLSAPPRARPECDGVTYGINLNRVSCFDAYRTAGQIPDQASWGPRGSGYNYQYKLPARFISGKCVPKKQYNTITGVISECL